MVFDIDSQTIVSAARVEPAPMEYSFRHSCVALPLLPHSHGLEVPEWNIIKSQISGQKSVVGKWVVDLSTHMCTNDNEIYGVVKIRTTRNTEEWFLLNTFLSGRPDRTEPHKKMLYSHLDKYLEYRKNKFHPIFVRTKITLAKSKKETQGWNLRNIPASFAVIMHHTQPLLAHFYLRTTIRECANHTTVHERMWKRSISPIALRQSLWRKELASAMTLASPGTSNMHEHFRNRIEPDGSTPF